MPLISALAFSLNSYGFAGAGKSLGFVVKSFAGSDTFVVPAGVTSVDYLVVGGGGGGGAGRGGGGAGRYYFRAE